MDGQLGNGTRRELLIPSPLSYDPTSALTNIPPRTKNLKDQSERNNLLSEMSTSDTNEPESGHTGFTRLVKAVKICCGSDFTIAIQPGNFLKMIKISYKILCKKLYCCFRRECFGLG